MAKEFYGYFDSTETDERVYQADEFAEAFRAYGGTGVGRGLAIQPAGGLNVIVQPGAAMIRGYTYALTDDGGPAKAFALSTSGTADRIDCVVLRLNLSTPARTIVMYVLQGTPGPDPQPPALTNGVLVHEISLGQVRIGAAASVVTPEDITDDRYNTDVCGLLTLPDLQPANLDQRYATQGELQALTGGVVMKTDIADNLTTNDPEKVLSAAQGVSLGNRMSIVETSKASATTFAATLIAAGWSATAPYTQTVTVSGITALMNPFADVSLSTTAATAISQLEAWGMIGKIVTNAGSITATAYEDKPGVNVTVRLLNIM